MTKRQSYWMVVLLALLLLGCSIPSLRRTSTSKPTVVATATWTATAPPTDTPLPEATATAIATNTATATATATSTQSAESSTPTATATPEPEAVPAFKVYDLKDVRILADDLPSGFIPFDIAAFGMDVDEFAGEGYEIENFDFYLSIFPPEFAFAFLMQAKSEADLVQVDAVLDNPEAMLDRLASEVGELKGQETLADVPEIADKSSGVSVVMEMAGQEYRVDMVVFRRESVVGFVGVMHTPNRDARASVSDLAVLLDERLQEAMGGQ